MDQGQPMEEIIDRRFETFRDELARLLKDMHSLVDDIGNDEIRTLIDDIRKTVDEPFLFVVVGEIKAGKSSMINALLGETICPVDPAPCTDNIQLIVHGETPIEAEIAPHVRRIARPVDILKKIAIVDTPGTNTIIPHHEEITRRFVPSSGLVIFVFPAKNPHTFSAWNFLDYVGGEWRKKVIFVLQQADLATPAELETNLEKVREYADERGFGDSAVFAASARLEENGDADSGFDEIRHFIRETVTGGKHLWLKLQSSLDTLEQTLKRVYDALTQHEKQLEADRKLSARLETQIRKNETRMQDNVQRVIDHVLIRYDQITKETLERFREGLSVANIYYRSVRSVFNRKNSLAAWVSGLQGKMQQRLSSAFSDIVGIGSRQIVEDIQELAAALQREFTTPEAESRLSEDVRAVVDFGSRREESIRDIQAQIEKLLQGDLSPDTPSTVPESLTTVLMGGSILTILGALVLATTHTAFFDITGGLLTGAGLLVSGTTLFVKKKTMIDQLEKRIRSHRTQLEEELRQRIVDSLQPVFAKLQHSIQPFQNDIAHRSGRLEKWMQQGAQLQQRLLDLGANVEKATRE